MTKRKGQISVNTNDIFPIIKKWLYSEHDIFMRELVSNASDAITKRQTLDRAAGLEVQNGSVQVIVDSKEKTLTFKDNGLGMSEAEVEKYIAQLAFSGAQEFVDKMKDQGIETKEDVIGKFGLGFFSAFMVADKVVVESLSREEGSVATKWTSEGETEYEFNSSDKTDIGTEITLFINEESKDFLQTWKTRQTLKAYCDFMPYEIELIDTQEVARITEENAKAAKEEDKKAITKDIINTTTPLWKKDPTTLTDQDYKDFYRQLYPMDPDPLFWIHLNVDHPFTLQGVLFFPKINPAKPVNDSNIKLYCRQVFVSDNIKTVVPEFLSLLKGAIDSTDIPLNVSRSALQGDPNVKKISNYIIKKVAESLKKLNKNERERYENAWEDIGLFIKYGVISDTKFDELMRERILFKNNDDKLITLTEYKESIPADYKEKVGNKVIYFELGQSDNALRAQFKAEKIDVISTDHYIDPHLLQHLEMKKQGDDEIKFMVIDNAIEEVFTAESTTDEDMKIKDLFEQVLMGTTDDDKKKSNLEIEVKSFKNSASSAYFKVDEQMKKFKQMTAQMGQSNFDMPIKKTLVLNPKSNLIKNAYKLWDSNKNKDLATKIVHHVQDLANISGEGLNDTQRAEFVTRSQDLISELSNIAVN